MTAAADIRVAIVLDAAHSTTRPRLALALAALVFVCAASGLRHVRPELHETWQATPATSASALRPEHESTRLVERTECVPLRSSSVSLAALTPPALPRAVAVLAPPCARPRALARKFWRVLGRGHGRYGAG